MEMAEFKKKNVRKLLALHFADSFLKMLLLLIQVLSVLLYFISVYPRKMNDSLFSWRSNLHFLTHSTSSS